MKTEFTPPYKMNVGLDTLWVHVKYPDNDLYRYWYEKVKQRPRHILQKGIPVDGFVVRLGGPSYDLSVCQEDARILLSRFDEGERPSGYDMGMLVQLGPKFINEHQNNTYQQALLFLQNVGLTDRFPMTVNRVDLRVDVFDFPVMSVSPNMLAYQWVGRAKLKRTYSEGPIITGYEIGRKKSAVFLRIYDKVLEAVLGGDLRYWHAVWEEEPSLVTRFEWQVRPKKAHFTEEITEFALLNSHSIAELGKYLLNWGRLVTPNPTDSVKSRWPLHPLWQLLNRAIEEYTQLPLGKLKRTLPSYSELPAAYTPQLEGLISSAMAQKNPYDPQWKGVAKSLDWDAIQAKACYKAQLIKNGGKWKK